MKAVILHGTDANHTHNWFPWLKDELGKLGYEVWVPDLPGSDKPNLRKYLKLLLSQNWDFENNVIIGHSSGAVTILGLLQSLPGGIKINTAILVGSFSKVLAEEPDWEQLRGLFKDPFDFQKIKSKAKQFIFVHGSNDPWCPIEQAKDLQLKLDGEMIVVEGGQHFSIANNPKWKKFPEILDIIEQKVHK